MSYTEPQKLEIYNRSQQSNITVHLFTTYTVNATYMRPQHMLIKYFSVNPANTSKIIS